MWRQLSYLQNLTYINNYSNYVELVSTSNIGIQSLCTLLYTINIIRACIKNDTGSPLLQQNNSHVHLPL
jgi:hypothetical protein